MIKIDPEEKIFFGPEKKSAITIPNSSTETYAFCVQTSHPKNFIVHNYCDKISAGNVTICSVKVADHIKDLENAKFKVLLF